jgi:hypothetical protein
MAAQALQRPLNIESENHFVLEGIRRLVIFAGVVVLATEDVGCTPKLGTAVQITSQNSECLPAVLAKWVFRRGGLVSGVAAFISRFCNLSRAQDAAVALTRLLGSGGNGEQRCGGGRSVHRDLLERLCEFFVQLVAAVWREAQMGQTFGSDFGKAGGCAGSVCGAVSGRSQSEPQRSQYLRSRRCWVEQSLSIAMFLVELRKQKSPARIRLRVRAAESMQGSLWLR